MNKIFELLNRRIGQMIRAGERDVARQYARTLAEIRKLMADLYERYEVDGKLTWADMQKYDRYKKFMKEVNFLLNTQYREIARMMPKIIGNVYQEGYYLTAYGVEQAALAKLNYAAVKPEVMAAMVNNPVAGLTLAATLERNRVNIIHTIQQEVTQGLVKGETYSGMAKRLKSSLEGDAVKAMRIVRTEGHRVQESAKHDAVEHAEKNGVVMAKTWNSSEDERVRKGKANHRKLNNKTIPIDEDFDDGLGRGKAPGQLGAAGSDINCRCFLTYEVIRVEKPQHKELEGYTFEQWKKERVKAG